MIHTYTDEDVTRTVGWREVLQDLPAAFESLRSGDAAIQARQRIDCGSWKLSGMGALWESRGVAAYKTYTSLNGQFDFLVNLFDLARQDHHVMPAAEITRAHRGHDSLGSAQHHPAGHEKNGTLRPGHPGPHPPRGLA
ncbi:hypothetical protein PMI15_02472 [Polaromonas sp. CF318]|uniref:hypothetical protein n=1 Tax=Polaromonas sp. CF318 TaxID=1144318 RepID=UPI000270EAB7|nr:hypothetical protein [Polaromonas sp. CF318]EJL83676.1 hypothetical protein PMI15_02472 [Polaromonas sp. CF318]